MTRADAIAADICDGLGLGGAVRGRACDLALRAQYDHPINRAPSSVAAGAVYLAALLEGENATQAEVSEVADVSHVAIRHSYQEIAECEQVPIRRVGEGQVLAGSGRGGGVVSRLREIVGWSQ